MGGPLELSASAAHLGLARPPRQGPGTLAGAFQWVKPTQDNLGALKVPVPSGFTQAHSGGLPVPGINL